MTEEQIRAILNRETSVSLAMLHIGLDKLVRAAAAIGDDATKTSGQLYYKVASDILRERKHGRWA